MMEALAGNAHISFEGNLPKCGPSSAETDSLKRGTVYPRLDFIVFPLEPESFTAILMKVFPEGSDPDDIIHIQIEKDGRLAFGAYDNFHPECTVASLHVSPRGRTEGFFRAGGREMVA